MTLLYATGSAAPLSTGTIDFLVTTPAESVLSVFVAGVFIGLISSIVILCGMEFGLRCINK